MLPEGGGGVGGGGRIGGAGSACDVITSWGWGEGGELVGGVWKKSYDAHSIKKTVSKVLAELVKY